MTPLEHFVDTATAAEFLAISESHLRQLVRKGIIPGHPLDLGGQRKLWRFLLTEVSEFSAGASCAERVPFKRQSEEC